MPVLSTAGAEKSESPAQQPRGFWETIITVTPVVLTLLSTLLAGLSSSAMIRAQYYRSLAAQYQSKAGDQWAFFQAKRMRRALLEQDLERFPGRPETVDPTRLAKAIQSQTDHLRLGGEEAGRLLKAVEAARDLGPAAAALTEAARRLDETARQKQTGKSSIQVVDDLHLEPLRTAFAYLGTDKLPGEEKKDNPASDPALQPALQALQDRRPEGELQTLMNRVDERQLQEAVETAEARARAFEAAADQVEKVFRDTDRLVKHLDQLTESFHRETHDLEAAWKEMPAETDPQKSLRPLVQEVVRTDNALQRNLAALRDYQAARKDYTARRYGGEANTNRATAGPYELRVYKAGDTSDRYRIRSQRFFYGMLCAQAGAAIASLALAGRLRSGLWLLASLAGFTAVGYTLFVYLSV